MASRSCSPHSRALFSEDSSNRIHSAFIGGICAEAAISAQPVSQLVNVHVLIPPTRHKSDSRLPSDKLLPALPVGPSSSASVPVSSTFFSPPRSSSESISSSRSSSKCQSLSVSDPSSPRSSSASSTCQSSPVSGSSSPCLLSTSSYWQSSSVSGSSSPRSSSSSISLHHLQSSSSPIAALADSMSTTSLVNPDQPLPRASPLDDADDACSARISNWITKGIHDSRQTKFARVVIFIVMKAKVIQSRKQNMPIVSNLAAVQRHDQHQSRQLINPSGLLMCAEEHPSILDMALSLSKWSDISHEMSPAKGAPISVDCMHPVKFIGRTYQDSGCAKSHQIAFEIASVCVSSLSAADQLATVNPKRLDAGSCDKFANVELALLSVLNHASSHASVSFTTSALDSSQIVCGNLAVKYDPRAQPHNIAYLAMARREFLCHMKGRIGSVTVRTFHASGNGRPDGIHKRIFAFELLPKNIIRLAAASTSTLNYVDNEGRSIAPEANCEYM